MHATDVLKSALASIQRRRLRSALAALGLTISVASVVAILSVSEAVSNYVQKDLESLISNGLLVTPAPVAVSGPRSANLGRLTDEDVTAARREVSTLTNVAAIQGARAVLVRGNRSSAVHVTGVDSSYFRILHLDLKSGQLWSERDEAASAKVCVLAEGVAATLFGEQDPIGQSVRLGNSSYRIVGILAARGTSLVLPDQEDRVLMPLGSFRKRVSGGRGRVDNMLASVESIRATDSAAGGLDRLLRARHDIAEGEPSDYKIRTQREFREKQQSITNILTTLLLSVASISLVVGGVGVMNIMLVTVAERSREIGVRSALGARPNDILVQFIVESIVICLAGGSAGLVIGQCLTLAAGHVVKIPMSPTPTSVALGLGVSVLSGVVFGFLPARRAAYLHPVAALRTE